MSHQTSRLTGLLFGISALFAAFLTGCAANAPAEPAKEPETSISAPAETEAAAAPSSGTASQIPALEDDFYESVNHDLLSQWEIPEDQSSVGWFAKLGEDNLERIGQIIKTAAETPDAVSGSDHSNIAAYYLTAMDQETRNENGFGPTVSAFFEKVDAAETISELLEVCARFQREYGYGSLFGLYYGVDGADSGKNVLYLLNSDTHLSREEWFSEDEQVQAQNSAYLAYLEELCQIEGMSEEDAAASVKRTSDMMKDWASVSLTAAELYDASLTYNVFEASDLEELFNGKISMETLTDIYGIRPDEMLIVLDTELARKTASWLTEENLPLLKEYVKITVHNDLAPYMDIASFDARMSYNTAIQGLETAKPFETIVSEQVQETLGFECGRLYCEEYFAPETTEDIEKIVSQVVAVFRSRLQNMDWMSQETRAEAIKKLDTLDVQIGMPEVWPQDLHPISLTRPEDGGLYVENHLAYQKADIDYNFSSKEEPVNKALWVMTPQSVNAYYSPDSNSITFLAGILQDPFYSPKASDAENLGRIGMVVAHEITHAFDDNGSQYDENGNIRNWWTDEDREKFMELSGKVVDYYGAMEVQGIPVNGTQTLSENIADLGAVSCITEIAENEGYDLKEMYTAYAGLWAQKIRDEALAANMAVNTHAQPKIRVNAVLSATDGFYEAFGIKEGDGMYVAPEERPKIW